MGIFPVLKAYCFETGKFSRLKVFIFMRSLINYLLHLFIIITKLIFQRILISLFLFIKSDSLWTGSSIRYYYRNTPVPPIPYPFSVLIFATYRCHVYFYAPLSVCLSIYHYTSLNMFFYELFYVYYNVYFYERLSIYRIVYINVYLAFLLIPPKNIVGISW